VDICWSIGEFEKDSVHGNWPMCFFGYEAQTGSLGSSGWYPIKNRQESILTKGFLFFFFTVLYLSRQNQNNVKYVISAKRWLYVLLQHLVRCNQRIFHTGFVFLCVFVCLNVCVCEWVCFTKTWEIIKGVECVVYLHFAST